MHKRLLTIALLFASLGASAQTSGATSIQPSPITQDCVTLPYRISDEGTKLPDITWGLDLAWFDEGNIHRGVNFAGKELIDIVRLSFQTINTEALNGNLLQGQKDTLDMRINIVKRHVPNASINLNSDQKDGLPYQVTSWYRSSNSATQATRWSELIALTKRYVESKGLKVTSISPFNEPDYTPWHQGSKADFTAICRKLREDEAYQEEFADIKLCGSNTLNNDRAMEWYTASKRYLDEGNTHQLAGSFDNFAAFYQQVVKDGKVGVGDELHNTMECMVGSEYGMTKGIWWGTCDHTRSQFMKASRGNRLAYAEHRNNWTAASIYRHPGGLVQAFGGTSERQAYTTTYRLTATDHDVFYNGQGPTREYMMTLPGGTGYQQGQSNAETCVDIQDGEDVMPPLPTTATTYKIVNRASGLVLSTFNNGFTNGNGLTQERFTTVKNASLGQQWIVKPMEPTSGGDFSYYKIMNARDTTYLIDVLNWSLDNLGGLIAYKGGLGDNEQWYFEYAGDGWFYIRSRHSAHCIEVQPGTQTQITYNHRTVCQGTFAGTEIQQWRLIPVDITYDVTAPAAPTELTAKQAEASIRLTWQAPADGDLDHYIVLRSEDQQTWRTIHNNVPTPAYTDNTIEAGTTYYYRVQAVDKSLNRSENSLEASASATGANTLICHLPLDGDLLDTTGNGNHAGLYGKQQQAEGRLDSALVLSGSNSFLQLPATIANTQELTISTWVYWRGGAAWQRLFDFGTDTDHYVFLTMTAGSGPRLAIKNGGSEQYFSLGSNFGTNSWRHVAVTFDANAITVYFDGKQVARNTSITSRPSDFRPVYNYFGRSQFSSDPTLKATLDDIRIYNYALSAEEVASIADGTDGIASIQTEETDAHEVYTLDGLRIVPSKMQRGRVYIIDGQKIRF